jgi:hypothetical protein
MKPETLQKMMRHKRYKTTSRYINLTEQLQEAVEGMPLPEALRPDETPESPNRSEGDKAGGGRGPAT